MDRYRVEFLPGYLSAAAGASERARRLLIELIRDLGHEPRAIGLRDSSDAETFSVARGGVLVHYVVNEVDRAVSIHGVVVVD